MLRLGLRPQPRSLRFASLRLCVKKALMPDEIQQQLTQPTQPNPERKTLDDRAKMTELERIRHSAAHVMATAILRLWPDAQFAAGPPVENGFYYDVDLQHRISPEDFP